MKLEYRNFPETLVDICEYPKGKSETVPGRALHIGDIMLRSLRGAILPEVQNNHLEYGDDEDFEDAMPQETDLTDIDETLERRSYLEERIKQIKAVKKSKTAQTEPSEVKEVSDELESPKDA